MNLADTFFVAIAALTLTGAFFAVWLKNVFYNALSLIVSLFGVACLFIYLNCEFLAVMEVIIYIGAISIAIIFAIMLSHPMLQSHTPHEPKKMLRALAVAVLLFAGLIAVIRRAPFPSAEVSGDYSMKTLGKAFLTTHVLPFEIASLILLVAIMGALVIASSRNSDE